MTKKQKSRRHRPDRPPLSVALQTFAALVGRSLPTVQSWIREGMPTLGRHGREHRIEVGPAVRWLLDRTEARVEAEIAEATKDPDLLAARTRKVTAEAQIAEQKLARDIGELVSRDDVILAGQTQVKALRATILSLPVRLANAGAVARDQVPAVKEQCRHLLTDIASWKTIDDAEAAAVQAAQIRRTA